MSTSPLLHRHMPLSARRCLPPASRPCPTCSTTLISRWPILAALWLSPPWPSPWLRHTSPPPSLRALGRLATSRLLTPTLCWPHHRRCMHRSPPALVRTRAPTYVSARPCMPSLPPWPTNAPSTPALAHSVPGRLACPLAAGGVPPQPPPPPQQHGSHKRKTPTASATSASIQPPAPPCIAAQQQQQLPMAANVGGSSPKGPPMKKVGTPQIQDGRQA